MFAFCLALTLPGHPWHLIVLSLGMPPLALKVYAPLCYPLTYSVNINEGVMPSLNNSGPVSPHHRRPLKDQESVNTFKIPAMDLEYCVLYYCGSIATARIEKGKFWVKVTNLPHARCTKRAMG